MDLVADARRMAPNLARGIAFAYILRLGSGILYVGSSENFEDRFRAHQTGTACRTTRIDPPKFLVWIEFQPDYPSARQREAQIKRWSKAKKEALIANDLPKLRDLSKSKD